MDDDNEPESNLLMVLLRYDQGWDQAALAEASRTQPSQVSVYHRFERGVPREVLERMAEGAEFPAHLIDPALWMLRSFRAAARGRSRAGRMSADGTAAETLALVRQAEDLILSPATREPAPKPSPADREGAEALWELLQPRADKLRRLLVEDAREYRSWALCERVVAESIALAANHPQEALELAQLALHIAELLPGEVAWRLRMQGYALAGVSNGHRVCNDLPETGRALERALKLWEEGASGDPGLLNEAMVPWIAAVVHRDQRLFPEALNRVAEALALDRGELRGKILLSKSNILEIVDDPEGSTAALTEAAPLIDADREPRLALVLRHNLLRDLAHLERFEEAAARLPEVRALAERLGEELDLSRVVWMEGRVWAGLGKTAEALVALEQVRRMYRQRELAYDYALVCLDLALVHLKAGRTQEVGALAEEMVWIFSAQGVERETLAALKVFCEAAKGEVATVKLAQRIARFLHRAQYDPELRFEPEGTAGAH